MVTLASACRVAAMIDTGAATGVHAQPSLEVVSLGDTLLELLGRHAAQWVAAC